MKNKIRIAVIGCGHMARAIIDGMTNPASVSVLKANGDIFDITVCDRNESKLMPIKKLCKVTLDASAAVMNSEYVVIAVKPQDIDGLSGISFAGKTVLSVAAGVSIARLKELTGATAIVRVMPNLAAAVGESMTAYTSIGLDAERERVVTEILGSFGRFERIDESLMDAFTGIAGSGPAFVFLTLKAFYDEATARGFSPELAKSIAIQTLIGSSMAAERSDDSFDVQCDAVCSKGGTTERGVEILKNKDYVNTLRAAISASVARAKELEQ